MTARPKARRSSPFYSPSAFDLFKPSRDLVMRHLDVFGVLYIIPFILWLHSWIWVPAGAGHYWQRSLDVNYAWPALPSSFLVSFIGFSLIWLLFAVVAGTANHIMMQQAQLDTVRGRTPSVHKAWTTLKQIGPRMAGLYLLTGVIVGIGFILLIIPGLFMLRRYFLAPYVMLDKRCSIKEAMDGSAELTSRNTGAIWGVIAVMALIGVMGIVPVIGSLAAFIFGALYSLAPAMRYEQLKKLS